MVQCTNGTRVKASAPAYLWVTWNAFLLWLNTYWHKLGTAVWLFFPDFPVNSADLCASEPVVLPVPDLATWLRALLTSPTDQVIVFEYLKSAFLASIWGQVCECVPDPLSPPGSTFDATVESYSPVAYWPFNTHGSGTTPNWVVGGPALTSGGPGSWQNTDSACSTGFWSLNPTSGYPWGCTSISGFSRSGPYSLMMLLKNDGTMVTPFNIGDPGSGLTNIGLTYKSAGCSTTWGAWQGGVGWGCSSFAATQLSDSAWHLLVWTFNGATHSVYIDGALVGSWATGGGSGSATNMIVMDNWINHGYFTKIAVFNQVLSPTDVSALHAAVCTGGPVYSAPTPDTSPIATIPDAPAAPSCTTIADLCTQLNQVRSEIASVFRAVNWVQSSAAPTGWAVGATASGLTGASSLAVSDIIGVSVSCSVPGTWGETAEAPPRKIPAIGSIQFAVDGVPGTHHALHYTNELVLGAPPSTTSVIYNFRNGVVGSVSALERLK